jgi:hypothetical protein
MHTDGICYRELQIVQQNYSLIETDLVLLPNGPFIGKNDDFGRRCFFSDKPRLYPAGPVEVAG